MMPQPKTKNKIRIADGFQQSAQFLNCIGEMEGKHIRVQKPANSGSRFYNYILYFSVVLFALSSLRIFSASRMGERFQANHLALPEVRPLPASNGPPAPFVIVADKGFALTPHVMRPFPRRYVECAFRILSSKWRVIHSSMQLDPDKATIIVQACVIIYNVLHKHETVMDSDWAQLQNLPNFPLDHILHGRPGTAGLAIQQHLADYFCSPEGNLPWQMEAIRTGGRNLGLVSAGT